MNRFFNWLFPKKAEKTVFENTFSELASLSEPAMHGFFGDSPRKTVEMLRNLSFESPPEFGEELVDTFLKIQLATNANDFFRFYLPIVSHILFYQPKLTERILGKLVGPVLALGCGNDSIEHMIDQIQGGIRFYASQEKDYMTTEGQIWVTEHLPKMKKEISLEIEKHRNKLAGIG